MARLVRPVVLVGMMGSGKTAVGQALAARLSAPFRDCDAEIESAARMTIPEIFARDGEAFFRDREAEVLRRLLDEGPQVVATGGGAFLRRENRAAIDARGTSVWLRAPTALLWSRVKGRPGRPLLAVPEPRRRLEELTEERAASYARARLVVDAAPSYAIADMVDRVEAALRGAGVLDG
jgi:shikimate kinase